MMTKSTFFSVKYAIYTFLFDAGNHLTSVASILTLYGTFLLYTFLLYGKEHCEHSA